MIFTTAFWKGAGERAIKTFAQSLVGAIGIVTITHLNVSWVVDLEFAGLTTLASLLTSIGNADFTAGVTAKALLAAPAVPTLPAESVAAGTDNG